MLPITFTNKDFKAIDLSHDEIIDRGTQLDHHEAPVD